MNRNLTFAGATWSVSLKVFTLTICFCSATQASEDWLDTTASLESRVDACISQMTLGREGIPDDDEQ